MGDQNCSIAILARTRPDLAIDAAARVLCVQYLLIEQPQSPNLPEFSALAFSGLPKLFVFLLLRKHTQTPLVFNNPNVFIIDFKCGMFRGEPVRWNKKTIKTGYQNINGINISFIGCLQQKSIIKMDIIALIRGIFTEFSNNYYFVFSNGFSTMPGNNNKLGEVFLLDFKQKMKDKKYFKALKRLYSYFKIKKNKKMQNKLLDFFNSDVGKLNYQINNLQIIYDVIDNKFHKPKKSDVIYNLNIIKKNLPYELKPLIDNILNIPTLRKMKIRIQDVINELTDIVNDKTIEQIKI